MPYEIEWVAIYTDVTRQRRSAATYFYTDAISDFRGYIHLWHGLLLKYGKNRRQADFTVLTRDLAIIQTCAHWARPIKPSRVCLPGPELVPALQCKNIQGCMYVRDGAQTNKHQVELDGRHPSKSVGIDRRAAVAATCLVACLGQTPPVERFAKAATKMHIKTGISCTLPSEQLTLKSPRDGTPDRHDRSTRTTRPSLSRERPG